MAGTVHDPHVTTEFYDEDTKAGYRGWNRLRTVSNLYPPPRHSHSATAASNDVYVFGGSDGITGLSDLWRLTVFYKKWPERPSPTPIGQPSMQSLESEVEAELEEEGSETTLNPSTQNVDALSQRTQALKAHLETRKRVLEQRCLSNSMREQVMQVVQETYHICIHLHPSASI